MDLNWWEGPDCQGIDLEYYQQYGRLAVEVLTSQLY